MILSEHLVSITAGGLQTCGLAVDGVAYCWGADDYGALGNGDSDSDFGEPVEVTGGIRFRSITAGDYAVCGVALDGTAYCWGRGVGHVLGNGSESNQPGPTLVASSERWTNIYPDVLLSCGATTTAALNCWGPTRWDTARYGTYRDVATTPSPMTTSAGIREMAGMCMNMTEGPAHCMSIVVAGHLNTWVAQPIPGSIEFTRVVGNRMNACGISLDRRIYCWGTIRSGR